MMKHLLRLSPAQEAVLADAPVPMRPRKRKFLRLLPTVVVMGAGLFALKTTDLVHTAYAQAAGQVASLTNDPVPANPDYAGGEDDSVASASQVDVLGSMARRRRELDARQGQLTSQANLIAAAENRVDAKIAQLKQLQAQINALLAQRDDAQKAQVASLVKTYSTMKPKDAARIFNTLPDEVLVPVAQQMKSDVLALILSNMAADNAQKLTVKLADKLALPQTTDAPAPVLASALPAAPSAEPPPLQSIVPGAPAAAAPAPASAAPAAKAPAAAPKAGG